MTAGKNALDGQVNRADAEASVKRNPHPDFKSVEASRPDWRDGVSFAFSKSPNPDWSLGDGANDGGESLQKHHVEIDPFEEGRPSVSNYKLLISGIVPRPIGFLSTRSKDGTSTNLAPMSYTQVFNHDPPIFGVGFAGGFDHAKDTLRNLAESRECVINMISEHFVEAANMTAINAPYGISEWVLSGLTPAPASKVQCSRVKESVFAIEGQLLETREFDSKATPGQKSGVLAIIEGVNFWVREDAINADKNLIDPDVLKPMSRLGGISYGRTTEGIEIPRPDFSSEKDHAEAKFLLRPKADKQ
ncbi:MAG: hypothetical protein M1825_004649 [Sarcosagium campestre]|nr:MAG: hypothetical protein M1825_004649 [Sarcosagium campestre]